jgi:hypothetical protein
MSKSEIEHPKFEITKKIINKITVYLHLKKSPLYVILY